MDSLGLISCPSSTVALAVCSGTARLDVTQQNRISRPGNLHEVSTGLLFVADARALGLGVPNKITLVSNQADPPNQHLRARAISTIRTFPLEN